MTGRWIVCAVTLVLVNFILVDTEEPNFGADPGCPDPWTTEWTRDPNDCTQVHYCIQGKKYWSIQCNDTRIWSNVGHACVLPMSLYDDCNQTPTNMFISMVLIASVAVIATAQLNIDRECASDPYATDWIRDTECSEVNYCIKGKKYWNMTCTDGRLWSLIGHACVRQGSLWDDCNVETTTININDPRCINPDGINPDPDNCAQFLPCTNRTVVATMSCPENTLFATRNNTCELAFLVAIECEGRYIPGHIVVTTPSPIIDVPCEETKNGDVPDIHNCARFYKCNHGRVVARIKCPSASAFSVKKNKCDWRANVDCEGRGT